MQPTTIGFCTFSNDVPCKKKVHVMVMYRNKSIVTELYTVASGHDAIIARDWIRGIDIELRQINVIKIYELIGVVIRFI